MASSHDFMQKMREAQAAREKAFEPLAEILGKRAELQRQLAELDAPYGEAFVAAEAAGWTAEELKAIGAEEPVKRPKGRSRPKKATAKKDAPETTSANVSTTRTVASVPAQEGAGEAAVTASGVPSA
ncbi:hypothetical protein OG840_61945 [Streptomyces sp. NBC_01764]|uniref:hypothetical protein n=1 Tax=Streptomyces sp. NBC_01764 TaxID=2975935 RepID=UPI002254ED44|nr:hypothetical protein [Streptomyces sp. NBC_01764]MCX4411656.1 hypothetical protein [Streptomyces sp. NBC_01764]